MAVRSANHTVWLLRHRFNQPFIVSSLFSILSSHQSFYQSSVPTSNTPIYAIICSLWLWNQPITLCLLEQVAVLQVVLEDPPASHLLDQHINPKEQHQHPLLTLSCMVPRTHLRHPALQWKQHTGLQGLCLQIELQKRIKQLGSL